MTKLKKAMLVLVAFLLVMAVSTTAVFADDYTVNVNSDSTNVYGASPQDTTVPIYGYIGDDAVVSDPDPSDPNTPPVANAHEINVSVPIKVFWGAFKSDNGAVVAPDYQIKNNSSTGSVNVQLTSFTGANSSDNTLADANLTLNMTKDVSVPKVVDSGSYPVSNKALGKLNADAKWTFSFDGAWTGDFAAGPFNPKYNMVLSFSTN